VIGGLFAFGLVGIFVGPVVLAVAWTLLDAWMADGDVQPVLPSPAGLQEADPEAAPPAGGEAAPGAGSAAQAMDATEAAAPVPSGTAGPAPGTAPSA
jgi:hypothetical protein